MRWNCLFVGVACLVVGLGCNEERKTSTDSGPPTTRQAPAEADIKKGADEATEKGLPTTSVPPTPSVVSPSVSGCTMESIQAVVRTRKKDVTTCYTKGLLEDPSIGGRIAIELGIQVGGKLAQRSVYESDLPIPVGACIVQSLKGLEFPGEFAKPCVIVYPFVFSSGPRP